VHSNFLEDFLCLSIVVPEAVRGSQFLKGSDAFPTGIEVKETSPASTAARAAPEVDISIQQ
jgi:hypothetical protein